MSENFDLAEAVLEFAGGTAADWEAFDKVIPNNVMVFTSDTMMFKIGNGADLYADLPDGPSFAEVQAGSSEIMDNLVNLTAGDDDCVIFINNDKYDVSSTTLQSLLTRITDIASADNAQDANLDTVDSQNNLVDQAVTAGDDDKLVVASSGKISPGVTLDALGGEIVPAEVIHIQGVNIYTDDGLTNQVDDFRSAGTYFVEVDGFHDIEPNEGLTFTLSEDSPLTIATKIANNIFKVVTSLSSLEASVTLTVSATFGADTVTRDYLVDILPAKPLVAIYGGASLELYYGCTTDSSGNIICVGYTLSEGQGSKDALVVKFDGALNILARKVYGGNSGDDILFGCTTDSSGNIICVGYTLSEGQGSIDALVVKFDGSLNIIARKIYGGSGDDIFDECVVDSSGNIFGVGYTYSEGQGNADVLVVKFDSNLTILARKVYGGVGTEALRSCAIDSSDNLIGVGYTSSEGQGSNETLVIKFDNNLNILARKIYGGTGTEVFRSCDVDSNDNIICAGYTRSEGQGGIDALVVKFDNNLNILARKVYGGTATEMFHACVVDSDDNIICAGYTESEGEGSKDAFVVKFDASLSILARKIYGGVGAEEFNGCAVDYSGNIICVGYTSSEGQGSYEALVLTLPSDIPSGSFIGSTLTELTLADSALTLANSTLTLANSTLILADSTLTLANSALTLANSNLTLERDILG